MRPGLRGGIVMLSREGERGVGVIRRLVPSCQFQERMGSGQLDSSPEQGLLVGGRESRFVMRKRLRMSPTTKACQPKSTPDFGRIRTVL
jgi:hypothetical protein